MTFSYSFARIAAFAMGMSLATTAYGATDDAGPTGSQDFQAALQPATPPASLVPTSVRRSKSTWQTPTPAALVLRIGAPSEFAWQWPQAGEGDTSLGSAFDALGGPGYRSGGSQTRTPAASPRRRYAGFGGNGLLDPVTDPLGGNGNGTTEPTDPPAVPLPASGMLLLSGLAAVTGLRRKMRRKA